MSGLASIGQEYRSGYKKAWKYENKIKNGKYEL